MGFGVEKRIGAGEKGYLFRNSLEADTDFIRTKSRGARKKMVLRVRFSPSRALDLCFRKLLLL